MNSGKTNRNETSIRFCGIGGMGVILTSIILGKAAIFDNKNAIQTQSYGPEQRGTKVKSDIILSEDQIISYPINTKIDILVAFSQKAFDFYFPTVRRKGLIFINSDLVNIGEKLLKVYKIPANSIGKELKNEKILNMIMLGGLIKITNLVSTESIIKAIKDTMSSRFIELNISAFKKGYDSL